MHHQINYQLILTYDGSRYFGWQKTKTGISIEQVLQTSLEKILQQKISLQAASRTDRGVHALHQVVNFFSDRPLCLSKLLHQLNQVLPDDIRVLNIEKKHSSFHPSLDTVAKMYTYYIDNQMHPNPFYLNTSFHVHQPLCIDAMDMAARYCIGYQDFRSFTNAKETNTYRTIFDIFIKKQDPALIKIDILGDRFLYKMVRNLIGCLVYVGCDKISPLGVKNILEEKRKRKIAITAPAAGLFLTKVIYKEYDLPK